LGERRQPRQPPRILPVEGERRADEDMAGEAACEVARGFGEGGGRCVRGR
jgi:hypothetical protein